MDFSEYKSVVLPGWVFYWSRNQCRRKSVTWNVSKSCTKQPLPGNLKLHFACCAIFISIPKTKQTLPFPPGHVLPGKAIAGTGSIAELMRRQHLNNVQPFTTTWLCQGTPSVFLCPSSPPNCFFCFFLAASLLPAPGSEGKKNHYPESHINSGFVTHFPPAFLCHHACLPSKVFCVSALKKKGMWMHLHGRAQRSCGMLVSCLCVCEPSLSPVVHVNMGRGVHGRDLLQLREEVAWPHAHFSPCRWHWASLDKGEWAFQPPPPSQRASSPPSCLATWKEVCRM